MPGDAVPACAPRRGSASPRQHLGVVVLLPRIDPVLPDVPCSVCSRIRPPTSCTLSLSISSTPSPPATVASRVGPPRRSWSCHRDPCAGRGPHLRGETVLRGAFVHEPVGVGSLRDRGAETPGGIDDVTERPAEVVDGVAGVERTHPPPSEASNTHPNCRDGAARDSRERVDSTCSMVPTAPSRTRSWSRFRSGVVAELVVDEIRDPRVAARSHITCASWAFTPNGLSHSTACPPSMARRTWSRCRNGGECTEIRSTSSRAHRRRDRVVVAR